MIRHLLFDLDGTLLPVDMDFFFRHYLEALAPKFMRLIAPEKFTEHLMASTMEMVINTDPDLTNEEVFWRDFPRRIGYSRAQLEPILREFYEKDFPKLKEFVPPAEDVRQILTTALEKNFSLIIATNPIFPESAIIERLSWINCHDLPYELITSFERMHFCKPNIGYYREIVSLLRIKPNECLMVGNDVEEDLVASCLGMKTCLITDRLISRGKLAIQPDYRCRLNELRGIIKKLNSSN